MSYKTEKNIVYFNIIIRPAFINLLRMRSAELESVSLKNLIQVHQDGGDLKWAPK